ncbi:MAG: MarC family protein [Chlamydiota bacterium]
MEEISLINIASSLFLIMNAVGQIPLFLAILAPYQARKQTFLILREMMIALCILLVFTFFGESVLFYLGITHSVIGMAGGILLFLVSLDMVFPKEKDIESLTKFEPMVVPLAIPVITGPGAITMSMTFASQTNSPLFVSLAVLLAWVPSVLILIFSPYIQRFLGEKGMQAVERLGGMLVILIAIQMFSSGIIQMVQENF